VDVLIIAKQKQYMNDLELIDRYCETCLDFINPVIFRDIEARGLTRFVNYLPHNILEAKAVARARLAKAGKCFGDDQIDQIANEIKRLESLRSNLVGINMADAHKVIPILNEMKEISEFVLTYFKPVYIPD